MRNWSGLQRQKRAGPFRLDRDKFSQFSHDICAEQTCTREVQSMLELVTNHHNYLLGIAKLESKLREINAIANVHVAFSRKSVVFFAPII